MSEVALLQLISLGVVGLALVILLYIKSRFVRVIGFVMIALGVFTLIGLGVPQMASMPPAVETFDLAKIKTPADLAAIGQKIFFSKGQCALCHSIGPSEAARCPDLKGIGQKLTREFLFESLTDPQAYIYLDYRHEGPPKEYPAQMPRIHKNPIALTKKEILTVIAFLQQMSGEPVSIRVEEMMEPEAVKVASRSATASEEQEHAGLQGR